MSTTNIKKIKVAVLGATGMVGQRMLQRLAVHPFFQIAYLGASSRSAGKTYEDATRWRLEGRCPKNIKDILVHDCAKIKLAISDSSSDFFEDIPIVFSALDWGSGRWVVRSTCEPCGWPFSARAL